MRHQWSSWLRRGHRPWILCVLSPTRKADKLLVLCLYPSLHGALYSVPLGYAHVLADKTGYSHEKRALAQSPVLLCSLGSSTPSHISRCGGRLGNGTLTHCFWDGITWLSRSFVM